MGKLSKMEISAIANKIADDVLKATQKYNDELRDKEFKLWLTKYQKTKDYKVVKAFYEMQEDLQRITRNLSWNYRLSEYKNFDKILREIFTQSNKLDLKYNNASVVKLEQDIIIAQAKNADIDVLITELTEKYSK